MVFCAVSRPLFRYDEVADFADEENPIAGADL